MYFMAVLGEKRYELENNDYNTKNRPEFRGMRRSNWDKQDFYASLQHH
jgi:hypothetical protein